VVEQGVLLDQTVTVTSNGAVVAVALVLGVELLPQFQSQQDKHLVLLWAQGVMAAVEHLVEIHLTDPRAQPPQDLVLPLMGVLVV
jgi:hypothetical protein